MKRIEVAVGVVYNPKGQVLVGQRVVKDLYFQKWEFPGGKVESNESHRVALEREWIEELDLLIECEPKHFGHGRNGNYEVWFYEVDVLNFETTDEYVNKEHVEVRYFKLDEIHDLELNKLNKAMLTKLTLKYK